VTITTTPSGDTNSRSYHNHHGQSNGGSDGYGGGGHQHHSCFEYRNRPNTGSLGAKKKGWRTYGAHVCTNSSWLRITGSTGDDDCGLDNSCLPWPAQIFKLLHVSMISYTKSFQSYGLDSLLFLSGLVYLLQNSKYHFPLLWCNTIYLLHTVVPCFYFLAWLFSKETIMLSHICVFVDHCKEILNAHPNDPPIINHDHSKVMLRLEHELLKVWSNSIHGNSRTDW
jgi:hypothetical protein